MLNLAHCGAFLIKLFHKLNESHSVFTISNLSPFQGDLQKIDGEIQYLLNQTLNSERARAAVELLNQ